MFSTIGNAFKIPELRKKMLFTLFIIIVFRIGATIPVPFLDPVALKTLMARLTETTDGGANLVGYINMLAGGAFSKATLFAMSVSPYINSSIIMQLLTVAIPALERLQKEGEEGRKKLGAYTRYLTVVLGLIQGGAYYMYLANSPQDGVEIIQPTGGYRVFAAFVIILTFTAGTALMMWLGEQINQHGIGNGISILLLAGILSNLPTTFGMLWSYLQLAPTAGYTQYFFLVPLFVLIFIGVIVTIVVMNDAERRIPVQYAKMMKGRKMYGGQSTHMPIKVGMNGVLPIIFASSILSIPSTIQLFVNPTEGFWKGFFDAFSSNGWLYGILYFFMIIMFAFFYVSIQYNPVEMANNLRKNNGTIPGIRPGRPTIDFIAKILSKITFIGAMFLAVIAIVPMIFAGATGMEGLTLGGTSVIIIVGVALETMRQLESQMMIRHYKGFLD